MAEDISMSVHGIVTIKDSKTGEVLFNKKNRITMYGKTLLFSSLYRSRYESLDGIKYLDVFKFTNPSIHKFSTLEDYKLLEVKKRFLFDRIANVSIRNSAINFEQYPLKQYYKSDKDYYRSKYMHEDKIQRDFDYLIDNTYIDPDENVVANDTYTSKDFYKIFRHLDFNSITVKFSILTKFSQSEIDEGINGLMLVYSSPQDDIDAGIKDVIDSEIVISDYPNLKFPYEGNTTNPDFNSGLPFSWIYIPNNIRLTENFSVDWEIKFTFN